MTLERYRERLESKSDKALAQYCRRFGWNKEALIDEIEYGDVDSCYEPLTINRKLTYLEIVECFRESIIEILVEVVSNAV